MGEENGGSRGGGTEHPRTYERIPIGSDVQVRDWYSVCLSTRPGRESESPHVSPPY